jgi:hypothetical protein
LIQETPVNDQGRLPNTEEATQRVRRALDFFRCTWHDKHGQPTRALLRLDEQLYVHLLTLDFLHYAEYRRWSLVNLPARRAVRPIESELRRVATCVRPADFDHEVAQLGLLKNLLEITTGEPIEPDVFEKCAGLAGDVLQHYLSGKTIHKTAAADTRLATACLCFALDLEQCRIPEIKPYVHGQGNISGSVRGAVRAGVNEKHEEFERICTEMVDWYQADLIGQTALHQAVQDLLCLATTSVSQMCLSHDTHALNGFLDILEREATLYAWCGDVPRHSCRPA